MKFLFRLLACVLGLAAVPGFGQSNPVFTGTVTFNNSLFAGSAIFPPSMLGLGVPSSTTVLYGDGRWRPASGSGGGGSPFNPYVAATNGTQQLRVGTGWASNPLDTYLGSIGASTTIVFGINGTKVGRINISGLNEISIGSVTPGTGQFTSLRATGLDSTPIGAVTPSTGVFTTLNATNGLLDGVAVSGLPPPVAAADAATKGYVDALAGGLVPKTGVRVATTSNIASFAAVTTVDSVTLADADRVLVKSQSAPAQNGIYNYTLATTTLARATDADTAAELALNQYYFVTAGTVNANSGWVISTAPATLGVDPVAFSQFSASASYTAAAGIILTGSQFTLDTTIAMQRASNLSDVANVATSRTNLGLGTLATQNAAAVAITGGTIESTPIGTSTASTGRFSAVTVTSASVGSTALTLANTSTGGHNYQFYTLGSGAGSPGYFGLGDTTTGLNPILIDTNARTTLVALEGTPIGGFTPAAGAFTSVGATGTITSTGLGVFQISAGITTGISNDGTAGLIGTGSNHSLKIRVNSSTVATFATSGLSVVGSVTSQSGVFASPIGTALRVSSGSNNPITLGVDGGSQLVVYGYSPVTISTGLSVSGQITGDLAIVSTASTPYIVGNSATPGIVNYGSIGANSPVNMLVNNSTVATFSSSGLSVVGSVTGSSAGARAGGGLRMWDSANADYAYIFNQGSSAATQKMTFVSNGSGALAYSFNTFSGASIAALTITPAGAVAMANGLSVTGSSVANTFTRTGTSTAPSVWGVNSDATTYNMLTLNNDASLAGMLGISGGGGTDKALYLRAPASGSSVFTVNTSTIGIINSYGLFVNGGIQATGIYNVRNYGALGDGAANDTAAIAAAIFAAHLVNGTVYFPPGIYMTDTITGTGQSGLTMYGDGMGVSIIKKRSPGQVVNFSSSNHINFHHLTFDGSCTTRTPGGQAVVFDCVQSSFCDNEIINSGEYAFFAGSGSTEIYDLNVSRNYIRACYADGINFQYVTRSVIANNIVDGSDDDCIALGYNGSGAASNVNVVGNFCRARSDLGTAWGRGILAEQVNDCTIVGNVIDTIKQTGIFLNNASGTRVTRVHVIGNTIRNAATSSGHAIAAYGTTDCDLIDNVVVDPAQGSCIEIADWQGLTVSGGSLTQGNNVFGRGIHADEGTGWAASWDNLRIQNVAVNMNGASTNSCVYLDPGVGVTMNTLAISGVTARQVVAGDYITIQSAQTGTKAVVANNITLSAGKTINVSTGGVFTVTNNN